MANLLGDLQKLVGMGPDMLIQGLAGLIDGVGTGTEWTGEQVDRLGELEQRLADSIRQLRAQQETTAPRGKAK
jgi:hypothetical protein